MKSLRPSTFGLALLVLSCAMDDKTADAPTANPYLGLTCDQLIKKITEEIGAPESQELIQVESDNVDTCIVSDAKPAIGLPAISSSILVKTRQAYQAEVKIFDYANKSIREFTQEFGANAEFCNLLRKDSSGFFDSYLVWDLKDHNGSQVTDGVYLWEIKIQTSAQTLSRKTKVGVFEREDCQ